MQCMWLFPSSLCDWSVVAAAAGRPSFVDELALTRVYRTSKFRNSVTEPHSFTHSRSGYHFTFEKKKKKCCKTVEYVNLFYCFIARYVHGHVRVRERVARVCVCVCLWSLHVSRRLFFLLPTDFKRARSIAVIVNEFYFFFFRQFRRNSRATIIHSWQFFHSNRPLFGVRA